MPRHRLAVAVVAATAAALALAGCSTASSSSSSSSTSAAARTYRAADLPPILKKAEKSLGVSGTVLDNAKVQAEVQKLGSSNALTKLLATSGSSISPATCKDMVTSALSIAPQAKTIASILTFGQDAATISSVAGKQLPASLASGAQDREQKLLSACSSMQLTIAQGGQSETVQISVKKADVTTKAAHTTAIDEQIQVPSSTGAATPVTVEVVSAVNGNLVISAEGASTTSTAAKTTASGSSPTLAKVVNAIVAASR